MKPLILDLLCVTLLCGTLNGQSLANLALPTAHVVVRVVDQDGVRIPDVVVAVAGTMSPQASNEVFKKGLTDGAGTLQVDVKSNGEIHIKAEKAGFYRTEMTPAYKYESVRDSVRRAFEKGRWQPEEITVEVVLKRIISPIGMFARRVSGAIPSSDSAIGFDLFAGDYVEPHGRGKTVDIMFNNRISERSQNDYDYDLIVSFPQKADGIVPFEPIADFHGSILRSPYYAPDRGFLPFWTLTRSRRPGGPEKSNFDPEKRAYFFRVRTVLDPSGKVISANYGKIYGEFMNFTYYLNPISNDRNVEFDPKRNLFTNLNELQRPTAP